jgi:hypothetical protein
VTKGENRHGPTLVENAFILESIKNIMMFSQRANQSGHLFKKTLSFGMHPYLEVPTTK